LSLVAAILETVGLEVVLAADGAQAVAALRA
jgi:CheY-like chemotaxis protein